MTALPEQQGLTLSLSREEQWVVHHVMLDRMELEAQAPAETDPPPLDVYRIFEKLEGGIHWFSQRECQCLRNELSQYAEEKSTPDRDKPITEQILNQLQQPDLTVSAVELAS